MKPTAQIREFEGRELRTPRDVVRVEAALMADVITGDITQAEFRRIQKETTQAIKRIESGLTAAVMGKAVR
jgi:hypothetical protein